MYYRLNDEFRLRGWKRKSRVLVKRPFNQTRDLSEAVFQTLLLCDGITDLTGLLTEELEQVLNQYVQEGIVTPMDAPKEIDEVQYYQFFDNRYVQSVFWSVTGRCNYRCRHCYMDAPEGALGEVTTEEALDFIDQMAECGILKVDITGGEPFVRRDFWQLVDRMAEHEMVIGQVYTNGWLLNEKVLDAFEARGMRPSFSISFDGVGWHDWMRGIPGAEEAAYRAFRLCKERDYGVSAEMCAHKDSVKSLGDTVMKLAECGVWHLRVGNIANTELWCRNSEGKSLSFQEYLEEMIGFIPEFFRLGCPIDLMLGSVISIYAKEQAEETGIRYRTLAERYDGTEKCLDCHLCGSVRWSCYITPEGRLLPCMPMTALDDQSRFPLIRDIGLKKGLSDSFYMEYADYRVKDLLAANAECRECEYRYKCGGGCRAMAVVESDHDLMGADRSQCILWREGYAQRIRQTAEEAVAKYCKEAEE